MIAAFGPVYRGPKELAMVSRNAAIAANRFGLGARPGEIAAAGRDPKGWLADQLIGPAQQPRGALGEAGTLFAAPRWSAACSLTAPPRCR
jgi:uncharacterized protein (DUF1800 family)